MTYNSVMIFFIISSLTFWRFCSPVIKRYSGAISKAWQIFSTLVIVGTFFPDSIIAKKPWDIPAFVANSAWDRRVIFPCRSLFFE